MIFVMKFVLILSQTWSPRSQDCYGLAFIHSGNKSGDADINSGELTNQGWAIIGLLLPAERGVGLDQPETAALSFISFLNIAAARLWIRSFINVT